MKLVVFLSLAVSCLAAPYYPPDSRFGIYGANTYTGVVGGIPDRAAGNQLNVTEFGWSAGNTAVQNSAALSLALDASAAGDVIHIPAGTYSFNGITLTHAHNNRTIRGAGSGAGGTELVIPAGSKAFFIGNGLSDYSNPSFRSANVTGIARGSSTVTLDTSTFFRGFTHMYELRFEDEIVTPIFKTNTRSSRNRAMVVTATSQLGTTLTLSQPLPSSFASAVSAGTVTITEGFELDWLAKGIGIEDLAFDCSAHSPSVEIDSAVIGYAVDCWVKNIVIDTQGNYALAVRNCTNVEVRKSTLIGIGGGTSRGGLFATQISYCLIEDNILGGTPSFYAWINCVNNVVAYNYIIGYLNANHNIWASHNLYEGNVWAYLMPDGFYGGSSEDTLFRNWGRSNLVAALKRGARNYNVIGNMAGVVGVTTGTDYTERWGDPNIGNETSAGTVQPSMAAWWSDWDSATGRERRWTLELTTRTNDTEGIVTLADPAQGDAFEASIAAASYTRKRNVFGMQFVYFGTRSGNTWPVSTTGDGTTGGNLPALNTVDTAIAGPGGFQEKDLDVLGTAIVKANWYVVHSNGIRPGEELSEGETLPDSYFRTSKPAWFGDRPFPPFDSLAPGTPGAERIPAGYRYVNGNEGYLGGAAPVAPSGLTATSVSSSQINLAWSDNSDNESGFRIERRVGAGSWGPVTAVSAGSTSYSNTGLSASTTYEYRVYAYNGVGDSSASNTASATTQAEGGGGVVNATVNQLNVQTLVIP